MARRASRPKTATNSPSARVEATVLPDSGQGISNDSAAIRGSDSSGVRLDGDLTQGQPGTQPELARATDAGGQSQERTGDDRSENQMLGIESGWGQPFIDGASGTIGARSANDQRVLSDDEVGLREQPVGRPGEVARDVHSGHSESSDEGSESGRLSPATVALFVAGARAGGYYGEPGWLDRAVVGTAGLLGQIVTGTLRTATIDAFAGDAPDPETAAAFAQLRRFASDREPELLEGDSAIGHLNNALQILELLEPLPGPTDNIVLADLRRRIELAVRLLDQEA